MRSPTRPTRLLALLILAFGLAGPALAQTPADQLNKLSLESLTQGGGSASPSTYARPHYYGRPRAYHGRPYRYGLHRGARPHSYHQYYPRHARPHYTR
jgi:hypothetical protein